jgi:hypothetical protein
MLLLEILFLTALRGIDIKAILLDGKKAYFFIDL